MSERTTIGSHTQQQSVSTLNENEESKHTTALTNNTLTPIASFEAIATRNSFSRCTRQVLCFSLFALFGNVSVRSQLCNIIVLIWPQDHLLETTWSPFFQAHLRRGQRKRPSGSHSSCVFSSACLQFLGWRCFHVQLVQRSVVGVTMTVC